MMMIITHTYACFTCFASCLFQYRQSQDAQTGSLRLILGVCLDSELLSGSLLADAAAAESAQSQAGTSDGTWRATPQVVQLKLQCHPSHSVLPSAMHNFNSAATSNYTCWSVCWRAGAANAVEQGCCTHHQQHNHNYKPTFLLPRG
jgi:hypothetical protein